MTYFEQLQEALAGLDKSALDRLRTFVLACQGILWLCGNGGSAAIVQHWACDLSKRAGWRAQALGSNIALLTALANDVAYEDIFSIELRGNAQVGDALICLSCSGKSENIVYAICTAQAMKVPCALITRSGRQPTDLYHPLDVLICIPSQDYGIIEDCFSAIGHWLTEDLTCAS